MSCDPKDEELLTQDQDEHAYKGVPNVQIGVRGLLLPGHRKEGGESGWGKCTGVACSLGDCHRGYLHEGSVLTSPVSQVSSVPPPLHVESSAAVPIRETIMKGGSAWGGAGPAAGAHKWCCR